MSEKMIWTQDRDEVYSFDEHSLFVLIPIFNEGILLGFNLYMDLNFLGTFDCKDEALAEISEISESFEDNYFVSGYAE